MSPSRNERLYPSRYDAPYSFGPVRGTRVYLAGPMRGYHEYNFAAFAQAAEDLRNQGFTVWSPHEHDLARGFDPSTPEEELADLAEFMKDDLPQVLSSDAVVLLEGWEASTGATLEKHVASVCGIPSYTYPALLPTEDKQEASDSDLNAHEEKPFMHPNGYPYYEPNEATWDNEPEHIDRGGLQEDNEYPYERQAPLDPARERYIVENAVTGGQKETRPARFDLLPWDQLWKVAELYAYGATKYDDRNWEKGYEFSLSIAALQRHMAKFIQGESYDQESGQHHLSSVVFHALALMRFEEQIDKGYMPDDLDNRPGVGFDIVPEDIPGQLEIEFTPEEIKNLSDGFAARLNTIFGPPATPMPNMRVWGTKEAA